MPTHWKRFRPSSLCSRSPPQQLSQLRCSAFAASAAARTCSSGPQLLQAAAKPCDNDARFLGGFFLHHAEAGARNCRKQACLLKNLGSRHAFWPFWLPG